MSMNEAEKRVASVLGLTADEIVASRLGVTPEEYRAKAAVASLTDEEREIAGNMGMTAEAYARNKMRE